MSLNPALKGALLKVDRARMKFDALKESIEPFYTGKAYELVRHPYETWARPDGDAIQAVVWFSLIAKQEIPQFLGVGIGEIVHDLRSALDHIVFELAQQRSAATGNPFNADATQFPIFRHETKTTLASGSVVNGFSDTVKGKEGPRGLLDISPEARAHIKGLQPFATGESINSPLWHLHELNNWDKHRTIYTTCIFKGSGSTEAPAGDVAGVLLTPPGPFEHQTRVGGVVVNQRLGMTFDQWVHEVNVKFEFATYVAFKTPTPCADMPIDAVVDGIGKRVGEILEAIDEAFF